MATDAIPEVERSRRHDRSNRRTNIGMLVMVGAACIALVVGSLFILDAKLSAIRKSQVTNAQAAAARSDCQNRGFNAILKDVNLLIIGDKNRADYTLHVQC